MTNDKTRRVIFWDFDGTLVLNSKWSLSLMKALDERHPGHGVTREELSASLHEDFPWHDHEQEEHPPDDQSPSPPYLATAGADELGTLRTKDEAAHAHDKGADGI